MHATKEIIHVRYSYFVILWFAIQAACTEETGMWFWYRHADRQRGISLFFSFNFTTTATILLKGGGRAVKKKKNFNTTQIKNP